VMFISKNSRGEKISPLFVKFSYQTSSVPEFPDPSYASLRAYEFS
jgi:hypothetical protein